jgi:hypothetical protein
MEDYTYHLAPEGPSGARLAHARICESIAAGKPSLEIHPLGIGGKEDPVRLVFDAPAGPALNASLIDLGNRFRSRQRSRRRQAAQAAAEAAGGARGVGMPARFQDGLRGVDLRRRRASHRLQLRVTTEHLEDFAEIAGIEDETPQFARRFGPCALRGCLGPGTGHPGRSHGSYSLASDPGYRRGTGDRPRQSGLLRPDDGGDQPLLRRRPVRRADPEPVVSWTTRRRPSHWTVDPGRQGAPATIGLLIPTTP